MTTTNIYAYPTGGVPRFGQNTTKAEFDNYSAPSIGDLMKKFLETDRFGNQVPLTTAC